MLFDGGHPLAGLLGAFARSLQRGVDVRLPCAFFAQALLGRLGCLLGPGQLLLSGGEYVETDIGGTSLACPLFAGLQADAIQAQGGEGIGWANPALYARVGSPAFTDLTAKGDGARAAGVLAATQNTPTVTVTFGDDRLLKAGRGYDDTSGLGTPSPYYLWTYSIP
ncbi:hypothetical protein ABZZ74_46095 [Streptomyces sp. NPDC006476]|uniref:hypothetical protein n=1 Tax=Streptomyces sp. NPDC006476 TaxID=3157175 RepID=UPI0033A42206